MALRLDGLSRGQHLTAAQVLRSRAYPERQYGVRLVREHSLEERLTDRKERGEQSDPRPALRHLQLGQDARGAQDLAAPGEQSVDEVEVGHLEHRLDVVHGAVSLEIDQMGGPSTAAARS